MKEEEKLEMIKNQEFNAKLAKQAELKRSAFFDERSWLIKFRLTSGNEPACHSSTAIIY
ncbi:MAG: hypothetical protein GX267_02930 [Fibrobacter sp.]|jgi:hypothetical protein|nr:hypothetical protein [Fibrobacter sp.]